MCELPEVGFLCAVRPYMCYNIKNSSCTDVCILILDHPPFWDKSHIASNSLFRKKKMWAEVFQLHRNYLISALRSLPEKQQRIWVLRLENNESRHRDLRMSTMIAKSQGCLQVMCKGDEGDGCEWPRHWRLFYCCANRFSFFVHNDR